MRASLIFLALCCAASAADPGSLTLGLTIEPYLDSPQRDVAFRNLKIRPMAGFKVLAVEPGSPADGFIERFTIITSANGVDVRDQKELDKIVESVGAGGEIKFVGVRAVQNNRKREAEKVEATVTIATIAEMAVRRIVAHVDKFTETTFWKHREEPTVGSTGINVSLWQHKDGSVSRRLRVSYGGEKWAFIERATFLVDGKKFEVAPKDFSDINRDNDARGVWEWFDETGDGKNMELVDSLARCKSATVRLAGERVLDHELTPAELGRIKDVVNAAAYLAAKK